MDFIKAGLLKCLGLMVCCSALVCCTPDEAPCPVQCTCHVAPLHAAPFVHNWSRTLARDTMPQLHDNDVLDEGEVTAAQAPDGGVDVSQQGLHATCALYPDTNLTDITHHLPPYTMVLSVLQAAGNNYSVIEGDQLSALTKLRALRIQGFEHNNQQPITTNRFQDNMNSEGPEIDLSKKGINPKKYEQKFSLVLTDDALKSLVHLEIIDLCYVRLVEKSDFQRSRRHAWGPLSTTTIVDMPLNSFLKYADDLDVVELPHDFNSHSINSEYDMMYGSRTENNADLNRQDNNRRHSIHSIENGVQEELSVVLLNGIIEEPVPYIVSKDTQRTYFAPFTSQNALKYLRIAHAHIDRLGPELLTGLTDLHTLILEHDHIHVLPSDLFAHTQNVRYLSIAHNSLFTFDSKSLKGLSNLLTLDLENNQLIIIGSATLPHLPKLTTLLLKGNPVKNILPDSFIFTNSTEILTIGLDTVATQIHTDAFRQLPNLKVLKIFNISSESFQNKVFSSLSQLEDLMLHGAIPTIDYDAFALNQKLKNLDISNCDLSRVSVDAFFGLSELTRLDMSHNNLSELYPGTFDHLSKLSELYLHYNKLTTLPVGIFTPMGVKVLRLNHNPWDCTCNLLQLHPTMTNSVLQEGYKMCRYYKNEMVCDEGGNRHVFDVRVAPKCDSPIQFRHKDVYTVVHRHLKCNKTHWDPLLHTDLQQVNSTATSNLNSLKQAANNVITSQRKRTDNDLPRRRRRRKNVGKRRGRNWRPLRDYTPVPVVPLDLLNIAENEMLEEAPAEPLTLSPLPEPAVLQDQTTEMTKEEQKQQLADRRSQYKSEKQKIRQHLRLQRVRQIQHDLQKLYGKEERVIR